MNVFAHKLNSGIEYMGTMILLKGVEACKKMFRGKGEQYMFRLDISSHPHNLDLMGFP